MGYGWYKLIVGIREAKYVPPEFLISTTPAIEAIEAVVPQTLDTMARFGRVEDEHEYAFDTRNTS